MPHLEKPPLQLSNAIVAPASRRHQKQANYGMLAGPNESNIRPARPRMLLSKYFDRVAIVLSTICIVHCLAMPFVIAVLPVAAFAVGGDGHFHSLML
ncbi:MAG TPA: MerC domain-containing protein, partial [Gammaproteobacteria bacterium]|nr:MerC domain-containing protein [Gammaproteobacteria bacterium]